MDDKPSIAILLTCFNRRETTLACLSSIEAAVGGAATYRIVIVDDNSPDGTAEAVQQAFPEARVVMGNGSLYWNGGMRRAWQASLSLKPDFFVWLNDDTILRPDAIRDLLSLYHSQAFAKTIVTGCTVDPVTRRVTYGGYRKAHGLSQLRFRRLEWNEIHCDTMNGNCVLIPQSAVADIGINARQYRHAFGDNDYGLRATRRGYRIVEMKRPVAQQTLNLEFIRTTSTLRFANWRRILLHPKGVPVSEWWWFCRQHGGVLWPVNFVWRYVKMLRLRAG
jgi:GT2 family glycosyltransferase